MQKSGSAADVGARSPGIRFAAYLLSGFPASVDCVLAVSHSVTICTNSSRSPLI